MYCNNVRVLKIKKKKKKKKIEKMHKKIFPSNSFFFLISFLGLESSVQDSAGGKDLYWHSTF